MHFGEIEVRHIHGGIFWLDGGSMFGVVPKPLWEKKMPADERNRIPLAANSTAKVLTRPTSPAFAAV